MGQVSENWIAEVASRKTQGLGVVSLRKSATGTHAEVAFPQTTKPAVDTEKMSITHILVTKSQDLQGDVVEPLGCNTSLHEINPVVYYDHKSSYQYPIAKGSDGANYTVKKSANGLIVYADTFFTAKNEMSNQLFGLAAADLITGWSVGFNPKPGGFEVIRKAQGPRDRGAYHWKDWDLLEYSLTPQPVNLDAMTVLCEKGKFGSEVLNPIILKSLSEFAITNRPVIVKVPNHPLVNKGLPPDQGAPADSNADPYAEDDAGMGDGDGQETPTVAALYDAAQGILDICSGLEQAVSQSEHKGGKAFASNICQVGQKLAGKIKSKADGIKAELSGEEPDAEDKADGGDDEEIETDEEGGMVTKSGYQPKRVRWTLSQIQKANEVKTPAQDIDELKARILKLSERIPA